MPQQSGDAGDPDDEDDRARRKQQATNRSKSLIAGIPPAATDMGRSICRPSDRDRQ